MDVEQRLRAIEARLERVEEVTRPRPHEPSPGLTFMGFRPGEQVQLAVRHPDSEVSVPVASSVDADAAGRATFVNVRVDPTPPPDRRNFEARGVLSDLTVSRPVEVDA